MIDRRRHRDFGHLTRKGEQILLILAAILFLATIGAGLWGIFGC